MKRSELYRENPKRRAKVIKTFDGTPEYACNCIEHEKKFYRKEDQAILVGGKWHTVDDPHVVYDYEKKKLVHIMYAPYRVIEGVVEFRDNSPIIGFFSENPYKNCKISYVKDDIIYDNMCISYEIPKSLGFIEHINLGEWAAEDSFKERIPKLLEKYLSANICRNIYKMYNKTKSEFVKKGKYSFDNNSYNIEDSGNFDKMQQLWKNYDTILGKDVKRASRLIGDLKFGCEIECKLGNISPYLAAQLGVEICRDGSIGYSPEFVTVPYEGAKGLQSLQTLFSELNKRCTTDHSCSLHFHIGNVRKDREFIVALYKLYSDIQFDLHKMLPYYKTDPTGIKNRNYCQFLNRELVTRTTSKKLPYKDKVNASYNSIYTWLLEGSRPCHEYNRKNRNHPNGPRKWNLNSRYFSLNLINLFTSSRNTCEFRAHHAVLHPDKAINWLFICIAIVRYAEQHSSHLIVESNKVSITEVLNYYRDTVKTKYGIKVSKYLNDYYASRVAYFKKKRDAGDALVKEDYLLEEEYSFDNGVLQSVY